MTVAELVATLLAYPQGMSVYVEGYEFGVDPLDRVTQVRVDERDEFTLPYAGKYRIASDDGRAPIGLLLHARELPARA